MHNNQQRAPAQKLDAINNLLANKPVELIPEEELHLFILPEDLKTTQTNPAWARRWGRLANKIMENNLRLLVPISRSGKGAYKQLLENVDEKYSSLEYDLMAEWKTLNPLQAEQNPAAWHNQAKMAAMELLTPQLEQELGLVQQEN